MHCGESLMAWSIEKEILRKERRRKQAKAQKQKRLDSHRYACDSLSGDDLVSFLNNIACGPLFEPFFNSHAPFFLWQTP